MNGDAELLRRYAHDQSHEAFAELVRLHLNLVYFAALRQMNGDTHRAREVTQAVFTDLARKAASLTTRPTIAGWLHTSTRFAATKLRRAEAAREKNEREAGLMRALLDETESAAHWEQLRPMIDAVVAELRETDREAVLLRFFEGRPFAEVGAVLGVSEDAARMRVDRALDRLRALLQNRGVTSSTVALSTVLFTQSSSAAPAELVSAVTAATLAYSGPASLAEVWAFMSTTKITSIAAGLLILLAVAITKHEVRAAQNAKTTLAAAEEESSLRTAQLQSIEERSRATAQEIADLEKSLADPRNAQASPAQQPADATNRSRDPVAEGRDFLEANPDVKQALIERARARVTAGFTGFYATAGLSAEEIQKFETIQMELNGVFERGPQGPLVLWPTGAAPDRREVERRTREFLGEERYQLFREHREMIGGFSFATDLASALYFTDAPLTSDQAERFAKIVSQVDSKRGSDHEGRDWPTLLEQSKAVLSSPQIEALARMRDQDEFGRMMKTLLGK
jgi:RNA polymerase sigma factor (sigma-70 family)